MLKPVKILRVEENQKPKFVKTELVVAERDGQEFLWERVKSHNSVHIIVDNEETRELLLVKQVRIPVLVNGGDGIVVEACAGIVDKDLSMTEIAKEEVLEELGYDVPIDSIEPVRIIKSSVGTSGSTSYLFKVSVDESMKKTEGGGLAEEDIEVFRLPYENVYNFIHRPDYETDAVTLFLITSAMLEHTDCEFLNY